MQEAGHTMDEIEYHEGFPKDVGWYDVLIDGAEDRLLHRYCHIDNRHEWKDINGIRIDSKVLWSGEATQYP